jgi:membrane-bound serine protease (ClpP class)
MKTWLSVCFSFLVLTLVVWGGGLALAQTPAPAPPAPVAKDTSPAAATPAPPVESKPQVTTDAQPAKDAAAPAASPSAPAAAPAPSSTAPAPAATNNDSANAGNVALEKLEAAKAANPDGPVYVFPLREGVDQALLAFMRRTLKEAERKGASAFIIDMDTPGGRLDVTMEILDLLEMLQKTGVPTYTFVNPNAISAGAIIALGTKKIYMRPNATIGAAAVVTSGGVDVGDTMKSKIDSVMTARLRALSEENGHNPDVAEAFMVLEKEVKMGDVVIDSKETLLSLNGREAARVYNGKPLLAAGLVENLEELVKKEKFTGPIVRSEPTGFERLALWLTAISPLLLMGGIVGAYIEMKAPGFGIPGIASLICFALFFGGHLVAGLSGYEVVFIFLVGLILVIVEIFVIPGTLVAGLIGTVMMLGALLWAMVDYWPSTPEGLTSADFQRPMLNFITALVGTAVLIALLAKILPKTRLYNRLVLAASVPNGPAVTVPMTNLTVKVGEIGTATTTLRPAGKASFGSEVHDVVTNGQFLSAGTAVRVIEVDGTRVVVEAT